MHVNQEHTQCTIRKKPSKYNENIYHNKQLMKLWHGIVLQVQINIVSNTCQYDLYSTATTGWRRVSYPFSDIQ